MRIWGIMVGILFLAAGSASAVTVNLNDGRSVQGDIIKQDNKTLQLSVDGVTMTYYADEIKDVDGHSFAAGQGAPAAVQPGASAPVTQPDTSADQATGSIAAAQPQAAVQPSASAPVAQPDASADQGTGNTAASENTALPGTIDPDKKELILKFIDVFGTRQALSNNFELMTQQIQKEKPEEAQKIRERVKIDEIIDRLLPVYDRNFSSEDLKAFIAFYGSDEGRKLIRTIPELMKESVQESVKYMEEKFPEVKQGQ